MAPTKTRPLLWLLPAFAAAQSSCHKNKKGVRCNNKSGRDKRCWSDEKCGRGAAEPVVPTFAALDRCRRPRCAACGSGTPPVLYGEFHGPLVDRRRISRGTQLVLQHTGAAQSELCHGSNVHPEFREARMRRPPRPRPGGRAVACVTTPTNYPSSPRAAARTTSASASASTTTLPL